MRDTKFFQRTAAERKAMPRQHGIPCRTKASFHPKKSNKNEGNVCNAPLTKTILFFNYTSIICSLFQIVNYLANKSKRSAENLVISKIVAVLRHSPMYKIFKLLYTLPSHMI